jgi:hypothetical protein
MEGFINESFSRMYFGDSIILELWKGKYDAEKHVQHYEIKIDDIPLGNVYIYFKYLSKGKPLMKGVFIYHKKWHFCTHNQEDIRFKEWFNGVKYRVNHFKAKGIHKIKKVEMPTDIYDKYGD